MEQIITNYVKPELLVLVIVLYFLGMGVKHAQTIKDKYIPYILGVCGCLLQQFMQLQPALLEPVQEIAMAIFTAIVQGILVAGLSTYVNQIIKQTKKTE